MTAYSSLRNGANYYRRTALICAFALLKYCDKPAAGNNVQMNYRTDASKHHSAVSLTATNLYRIRPCIGRLHSDACSASLARWSFSTNPGSACELRWRPAMRPMGVRLVMASSI